MITLAAFFKRLEFTKESTAVKEATAGFDYYTAIAHLCETFYLKNPNDRFIVTTDLTTQIPINESDVYRNSSLDKNLMEAIVKRDTEISKNFTGKIILVGADHLIAGSVSRFFKDNFDIGILFNGGGVNNTIVLLNIHDDNKDSIIKFFELREAEFYKLNQNKIDWFGDQLSIEIALKQYGLTDTPSTENNVFKSKKIRFKFFFYGENEVCGAGKSSPKFKKDAVLIDFKGKRKQWFNDIYQAIVSNKPIKK